MLIPPVIIFAIDWLTYKLSTFGLKVWKMVNLIEISIIYI